VLDRARPLDPDDRLVAEAIVGRPTVVVLNKSDLPQAVDPREVTALIEDAPIIEVSALTGAGLAELTAALAAALFAPAAHAGEDEVAIFRVRHRDAARRAAEDLARAEEALAAAAPVELIASDLAAAAAELGAITGEVTSEDVLDRVFAEFCIGK
jgi:tRNA modification GTPase